MECVKYVKYIIILGKCEVIKCTIAIKGKDKLNTKKSSNFKSNPIYSFDDSETKIKSLKSHFITTNL